MSMKDALKRGADLHAQARQELMWAILHTKTDMIQDYLGLLAVWEQDLEAIGKMNLFQLAFQSDQICKPSREKLAELQKKWGKH